MPLYLTASQSSRIRKPAGRSSPLRRTTSSSPFSRLSRSKPSQQQRTKSFEKVDDHQDGDYDSNETELEKLEKLEDTGRAVSLATMSPISGVMQAITHIQTTMFCPLPERAAGMNSTRIAQVLNFRKNLPPIAPLAHVHGILSGSTRTEREIAALIASGHVRKLEVCGRGNEISSLGEYLVSTEDLEHLIQNSSIDTPVADKLIEFLCSNPRCLTVPVQLFSTSEIARVRGSGFFVSPGIATKPKVAVAATSAAAVPSLSRQASGAGDATLESSGGIGNARINTSHSGTITSTTPNSHFILSLPNTGPYLRLVDDARTHLLQLLGKSRYREAPLYLLQERWDGAVDSIGSRTATAKRMQGDFAGVVLPGMTKKWKQFYGLNFDWVLEDSLGAGLVELFETRSVGCGVRAV